MVPVGMQASMFEDPSKGSKTAAYGGPADTFSASTASAESSSSDAMAATLPLLASAAFKISFCKTRIDESASKSSGWNGSQKGGI